MPVVIEKDAFVLIAKLYVSQILSRICENEVHLATDIQAQTVRIVAKLSSPDFQSIKFSDLYLSIQKIVNRMGERHFDPANNEPYTAEFKLYDPYFETLNFLPAEENIE